MAELTERPPKPEKPRYEVFKKCGHLASGENLYGPYWAERYGEAKRYKGRWFYLCGACKKQAFAQRYAEGRAWEQQPENRLQRNQTSSLYTARLAIARLRARKAELESVYA
jgi:hypothetical protein